MAAKEEYLKQFGVEAKPAPAPVVITSDTIQQMKEKLEIRRLELELKKLETPDTRIDYFEKMLELQKNSFTQQLEMQKQQLDLKLEIEKLKIMGDGESDSMLPYLQMLAPLLPAIIKNQTPQVNTTSNNSGAKKEGSPEPLQTQENQEEVKEEMKVPTNAGELEEYKEAVRRGEITFEEAYEDFLTTPFSNALTKEQFKEKFEAIKNEKPKKSKQKAI